MIEFAREVARWGDGSGLRFSVLPGTNFVEWLDLFPAKLKIVTPTPLVLLNARIIARLIGLGQRVDPERSDQQDQVRHDQHQAADGDPPQRPRTSRIVQSLSQRASPHQHAKRDDQDRQGVDQYCQNSSWNHCFARQSLPKVANFAGLGYVVNGWRTRVRGVGFTIFSFGGELTYHQITPPSRQD
jgi:hypothetical protein